MIKDGKLFGKLNLMDLLIVIIALGVAVMVGLKFTGSQRTDDGGVDIVYTVKVEAVDPTVVQSIQSFITQAQADGKPGDQLMANNQMINAYVTQVSAAPSQGGRLQLDPTGQLALNSQGGQDLIFTIVGKANNTIQTQVGSQEVRVGRSHIVKTSHFELVNGITLTCEWKSAA